ncbi:uncharacterized protein LOC123217388 [Mangifera indica]|uniref:uncharacterized protein LOC123217388 n=1 Tax=Mangifera indica TaxID=29780 RepID=UPI001CFA0FB6|nr:uncharacterized protein LOC123217388 [Mangifera indica]XP_044494332.1 uncharacterized protein LOC123217388 [Mangifera indica]
MEEFGGHCFNGINNAAKKKRSQTSRRPRPDSQSVVECHDSTPPSEDVSKISSDENVGYDNKSKRKEFNLNQSVSGLYPGSGIEGEKPQKRGKRANGGFNNFYNNERGRSGHNNKRASEGVLAPANWRRNGESQSPGQLGVNCEHLGNESKVKKVKLKVGGVTRTIQANSTANGVAGGGSSKNSQSSDDSRPRQRHNLQAISEDSLSPQDKRSGLQGIPWKDFSQGGFTFGKEDPLMGKRFGKNSSGKQDHSGAARKSKRVSKRRVLDGEFEDDEDDEIRYLEKLKTSKVTPGYKDDEELGKKHLKLSRVSNLENIGTSRSGKDGKKNSRSDRVSGDTNYEEEEEEPLSDGEACDRKDKKQKKESVDTLMNDKREIALTTRQRALQSSKDTSSAPGSSLIEFPNGLPPAPPRKQKEKLTEVEQQLKKAEAAQRRRMQVEKANRENEAEAIKKILGQDSGREKRKAQKKKRQEALAQEKAASALMRASSTIRWVMGPAGTVVTFPKDMGLPSIFESKPCSYPPPRENCAGPSCTNPYKYRDSKSKLPLCSLQCYKAVQEKLQAETTC